MTSKKVMLSSVVALWHRPAHAAFIAVAIITAATSGGCNRSGRIHQPKMYGSPYPGPKLWAVAPLRNESGTSLPDGAAFADRLAQQLQQVEGIDVMPVNRVIEAMNAAGVDEIRSVESALALVSTLNVDGLIVGTITAWDPYEPPKIGVAVQLYARQRLSANAPDSRQLTAATTEHHLPAAVPQPLPVSQASDFFDAANGVVLKRLKEYAHGRVPPDNPAGWRRYMLSMDLYSEFVSHELMRRLFRAEWQRMHVVDATQTDERTTQAPLP